MTKKQQKIVIVDPVHLRSHRTLVELVLQWLGAISREVGPLAACVGPRLVQGESGPSGSAEA